MKIIFDWFFEPFQHKSLPSEGIFYALNPGLQTGLHLVSGHKKTSCNARGFYVVGVVGFEPTTPWSQTRCANRTALYPELFFTFNSIKNWRRKGDSNPRYPNRVRQFSKLLVSATHPSLQWFMKKRLCSFKKGVQK